MDLVSQFNALANQWADYCRSIAMSSNPDDYLRHPAYQQLIDLGPDIVPQIMARLATEELLPWEPVLEAITGVRFIENPGDYDPQEVLQKRLAWWARSAKAY